MFGVNVSPFLLSATIKHHIEKYREQYPAATVTKRIVLQSAGKIYDPVGFLSPYTIKLKCLLQELWLRKLAWDDELPPDIYATWLQWWFIHNCRTRSAKIKGPLTSQEVSYAENWLIRSLHEKEFPEEMRKLLAVYTSSQPIPSCHNSWRRHFIRIKNGDINPEGSNNLAAI
ncbi:pro-Pol polyprotein [Nephila pilipes]|uniref:Pro-Pol polyprotein n=1 Tax=Nephila pilipes TaxID=299642 RepID=A0A8X6T4H2_NEPPI|nr:pro-Pol polyprotein [Nephila pilipes]